MARESSPASAVEMRSVSARSSESKDASGESFFLLVAIELPAYVHRARWNRESLVNSTS